MASTFQIFEDENREKENRGIAPAAGKGMLGNKQEKRPTLAVIGTNVLAEKRDAKNIILNNEKIAITEKLKASVGVQDENAGNTCKPVAASNVPVDQFKAFSVYEDAKAAQLNVEEKVLDHTQKKCIEETDKKNMSSHLREPLSELKVDTPMSICGILSPMSVDKSILLVDETADKIVTTRSDLDRFFDVEEYQMDILTYLKEAESRHRPKPGYMRKQPDITHSMRTILVDWLVEVGEEYRLNNETLCLAVSYIDRFLSYMSVVRAKLQLVGTSAMFIAAKYEEIYPPDVGEFVYITDDTYTQSQVLRMEQLILKVLSFDLTVPTAFAFTNLICIMNDVPDKVKHMTMYLCELSMLEADPYLQYTPSKISSAALAVAHHNLAYPMWTKSLEEKIGYTLDDLKEIMLHLGKTHAGAADLSQQAIQEKYKGSKYSSVSQVPPATITEELFLMKEGSNESVSQMISSLAF